MGPPIQSTLTSTFSKKRAKASVAKVRCRPLRRTAGRASRAPTAAATAAPATIVTITGAPKRWASWAVVKAPMAAKTAWASEISPAMPVITVTDRNTIDRITAWVTRRIQKALATDNAHHRPATVAAPPAIQVATVSSRLRASAARAGGGGSTPAKGSVISARRASPGQRMSNRNRATNGNDGRRPWARRLPVGSSVASSWPPTPSSRPPASASGRLESEAKTAAAMAATMSRKKLSALTWGKSGAKSTPAIPATTSGS